MSNSLFALQRIPLDTRQKLVARLGGLQIRVPTRPETLLHSVPSLTPAEADLVTREIGGEIIYLPQLDKRRARDSKIRILFIHGTPINHIAAEVGLSATRVRQIIKELHHGII